MRRLYGLGAEIVYLTGRHEPDMDEGTRSVLRRDGFPLDGERARLYPKPNFELDDYTHKKDAVASMSSARVVASFENEPSNLVIMQELLPDALHVFMETECSPRPAPPTTDVFRITRFS